MSKMKEFRATAGCGVPSLALRETAIPSPAPGEALVHLKAASLNFRDLLVIDGKVPGVQQPDYVPLSDAAGEVIAVGSGVTRVQPGDRVSPIFALGWIDGPRPTASMLGGPVDGVARGYACYDAESLVRLPDGLGDLEAATLPCAGLTAWNALFGPRPLQKGEWILLQGTGGVSMAALQWAKAAGAFVTITSSSNAKLERAISAGADLVVNYREDPDWAAKAVERRGGHLYNIVVDVVGEAETHNCARALGDGGIIAAVGRLEGEASWGKDVGKPVLPIVVGNRTQHEAMLAFAADHGIRPIVDIVFDLERLPKAMAHLRAANAFGKIGINLL